MISGAQVRAARGLLGWARQELARRAVVSDATTYALENAKGSAANVDAMAAVQVTLEAEGIEFLNGDAPGVRLHPKMPTEFRTRPPTETAYRRSPVSQFHITDSNSLRIAREALHHRKPITISGMVGKGIRFFTGVVQSVEEDKLAVPKRWRVTILDGQK